MSSPAAARRVPAGATAAATGPASARGRHGPARGRQERQASNARTVSPSAGIGTGSHPERRGSLDGRVDFGRDDPRSRHRRGPPAPTATPGDPLVAAIAARLPGLRLLTEPIDREGYRARRDAVPPCRPAAGGRLPDDDRGRRRARPDRRRAARPDRPARRRDRPVRRRGRHRGRADDRLHRDGQDHRDRPGEPRRGRPAGDHQRPAQGRRRRRGPVLPAGSGQLRDVLDRGQPRARTPAACAASSTARRAIRSCRSRS